VGTIDRNPAEAEAPSDASEPVLGGVEGEDFVRAQEPIDFRAVAAIAGDSSAQRDVWRDHRRWVAAILLAHKPKWADVEDLLQDVAMAFVRKAKEIRDPAALRPWLRTVAINAAHAAARSGKIRPRAAGAMMGGEGDAIGANLDGDTLDYVPPPTRLGQDQEASRLMELAQRLGDGYREPLLLKAIQGLSYREIGRIMNLPETTVETRIARARKQLREMAMEAGLGASEASSLPRR
jgi:RNA polymerase sigma-70 factor (ECF subfamily)